MPPAKRARPDFSPPRPGKSKSKSTTKDTTKKSTKKAKTTGRAGTRQALLDDSDSDTSSNPPSRSRPKKVQSALAFVDQEASEDESEPSLVDTTEQHRENINSDASSPEPDMILAEVTTESTADTVIPQPLVMRILQHHFERKGTKVSVDARDLVTEYVQIFVREAIARSNNERMERDGSEQGGFLEVQDLEKSAVQLSLDF